MNTAIVSDGTLGTTVTQIDHIYNIQNGTAIGTNLFHSFESFSLGDGDIASFNGPIGVKNILGRVTGGMPSDIFGTIRSTIDEANFFLLNPAGILFGPNASLDVSGSVYLSTADFIQFGDNGTFYADLNEDSVLSVASPEAFGFLVNSPNGIRIEHSELEVANAKSLALVGGNIEISDGKLSAPDGQISIISLEERGKVIIGEMQDYFVESQKLGNVDIFGGSSVIVDGAIGGNIVIRSGQLVMDNSRLSSNSTGQKQSAVSGNFGIDIQVTNDISLNNLTLIRANVLDGMANGRDIKINTQGTLRIQGGQTPDMTMGLQGFIDDFTGIETVATNGSGNVGNIDIEAGTIEIAGEAIGLLSWSLPFSSGKTGNIRITSNSLTVSGEGATGGFIAANSFGEGLGSDIEINTQDGDISLSSGQIAAVTFGNANAGDLTVQAQDLILSKQSTVQAGTAGSGSAGSTNIDLSGNLEITEGSFIGTLVGSGCQVSCGAAGNLSIKAKDIKINGFKNPTNPLNAPEFTGIRTRSVGQPGGDLLINADNLLITDNGVIRSSSLGPERAGDISINLDGNVKLDNKGQLLATAAGTGDGGDIHVIASNLSLTNEASVTSESSSLAAEAGNAGDISLEARDIVQVNNSTVRTSAENASGGNIKLTAESLIQITNSQITSDVEQGSANAGSISIDPDFIVIQNSLIDTSADIGTGGDVTMIANSAILIDPFSTIDTSSQFGGSGTIDIRAPIQNLGETIAQLPEDIVKVSELFAARCAAQKNGKFSSFLQGTRDGMAPGASTFLPSPLYFSTTGSAPPTTTSSRENFDGSETTALWKIVDTTHLIDLVQGCTAISQSRS